MSVRALSIRFSSENKRAESRVYSSLNLCCLSFPAVAGQIFSMDQYPSQGIWYFNIAFTSSQASVLRNPVFSSLLPDCPDGSIPIGPLNKCVAVITPVTSSISGENVGPVVIAIKPVFGERIELKVSQAGNATVYVRQNGGPSKESKDLTCSTGSLCVVGLPQPNSWLYFQVRAKRRL